MLPEIGELFIFFSTAKEVWDVVTHIYSKVKDATLIYKIKTKLAIAK